MENISRELLLEDVAEAENAARRFVSKELRGKLLMSDSFHSFGGDPILSASGVDEMSLKEKREWIACRLWAVCQKIRTTNSLPPRAGYELAKYRSWFANPGKSHKEAGAAGGRKRQPYTEDLDILIEQLIRDWGKKGSLVRWVFTKLPGKSRGNIDKIRSDEEIDGTALLEVEWQTDGGGGIARLRLDTIRKKVNALKEK